MSDTDITMRIPADDEGFIALRCPHCQGGFKALASDLDNFDGDELFCALCGLPHERSLFLLTSDVQDVAMRYAENVAADLINNFGASIERAFRGSKIFKVTSSQVPKKTVPGLRPVTDLAAAELPCCETQVKLSLDQAASLFYCPFCGQAQS